MRSPSRAAAAVAVAAALACGCAGADDSRPVDTSLEDVAATDARPRQLVHGSTLVIEGRSFVGPPWGAPRVRFSGSYAGQNVDTVVTARFEDYDRLAIDIDPLFSSTLGADEGEFSGDLIVEIESAVDGNVYAAAPLAVALSLQRELQPRLDTVQQSGLVFVNDRIPVQGDGLLLGGGEGQTFAIVEGCFAAEGQAACAPVAPIEVPVQPESAFDRTHGAFELEPALTGIRAGRFEGAVTLRNDHAMGAPRESGSADVAYDLIRSTIFSVSPDAASLGQYVDIEGGGFVGGADDGDTLVRLEGTYTPAGAGGGVPVALTLVPEFVAGDRVRYVINEDDALGQALDLRRDSGSFSGTATPIVSHAGDEVVGDPVAVTLGLERVHQVVQLDFRASYRESLRHFGLRAVDSVIRERVLEVARRDYATINVEFRERAPQDYALYSVVEIAGPDPNGLGLLGYDNTPGKDTDNQRLYDRIGGVNAVTQEDGFPGFGGVFIESLFAFSEHPNGFAERLPDSDPSFDDIFDPFRPDRGGRPVSSADLGGGIPALADARDCPAAGGERKQQIACAVYVLGSLIGTTVTHEIGHSLGLANPYADGFHNVGDGAARLMDSGSQRSFAERAELYGEGPARFCDEEYAYLRDILATAEPADTTPRPPCF